MLDPLRVAPEHLRQDAAVSFLLDLLPSRAEAGWETAVVSGITQLGFADPSVELAPVGDRQVTYIPIRDLPGPEPGTPRSDYTQAERVGVQMVRLIAMFAMHLMSRERQRLKLFSFDDVL